MPSVTAGTVGAAVVVVLFAADVGIGGAGVVGNTSRVWLMSRIDTSSFAWSTSSFGVNGTWNLT